MEARSQSAAHQNEMNFIFNLNAFSWKAMQPTAPDRLISGYSSTAVNSARQLAQRDRTTGAVRRRAGRTYLRPRPSGTSTLSESSRNRFAP